MSSKIIDQNLGKSAIMRLLSLLVSYVGLMQPALTGYTKEQSQYLNHSSGVSREILQYEIHDISWLETPLSCLPYLHEYL